jgi:hypothetical protein
MAITAAPYVPPTAYGPTNQGATSVPGLQIVDLVNTELARFYQPHGYIYNDIVTPLQTSRNVGEYPVYSTADLYRGATANFAVADDAQTPIIELNYSLDTYKTVDYRAAAKLTRKEEVQAHPALRLEYAKTQNLLNNFATNKEYRLAQLLLPTNNGGSLTQVAPIAPSGATWDSGTSGSPANIQADIQTAILTVIRNTGYRPNTIILDIEVALAIGNDYTLKQQIQYLAGVQAMRQGFEFIVDDNGLPSQLFGLKVCVADGTLYQSGRGAGINEAAGTGDALSLSSVWGNYVRVAYIDPNAGWGMPSTVYAIRGVVNEGAGNTQPPAPLIEQNTGGQETAPSGNESIVVDRFYTVDPPAEYIRVWRTSSRRSSPRTCVSASVRS